MFLSSFRCCWSYCAPCLLSVDVGMTGERQVGAQRDSHFFSPVNGRQVHGIVNIYQTWAVLPLGYSGLLSLFLSPKKFPLERKIGSKVEQNQNPLQSFPEVIQKDLSFFFFFFKQMWNVNVYKTCRYFKNICLAMYNVHKKNAQKTCPEGRFQRKNRGSEGLTLVFREVWWNGKDLWHHQTKLPLGNSYFYFYNAGLWDLKRLKQLGGTIIEKKETSRGEKTNTNSVSMSSLVT